MYVPRLVPKKLRYLLDLGLQNRQVQVLKYTLGGGSSNKMYPLRRLTVLAPPLTSLPP